MLNWANRFNICCFLDNHNYKLPANKFECIVAAGNLYTLQTSAGSALRQLKDFHQQHNDWIFGHFSYDLKNEIEDVHSSLPDHIEFPDLHFFVPEYLCFLSDTELKIGSMQSDHEEVFNRIRMQELTPMDMRNSGVEVKSRFSKQEYCNTVNELRHHILKGDCYEINFCQEFYLEDHEIDTIEVFQKLNLASPNPFAAYYKLAGKYCLCASPERYLRKEGSKLVSQPIKGTILRDRDNDRIDIENRNALLKSEKERAENVMVVDLVRNDLSRVCSEGTVKVEELFGIYSFPQVHQMISTITGELSDDYHWMDAIKASFPMGSMTGAPKKKVMELIEKYERTKRGIFSGSIGYIDPEGNFDFNVVIRSIMYNESKKYVSWQTGSAITFGSDPEKEFEECLLKGSAIKKVLTTKDQYPHGKS